MRDEMTMAVDGDRSGRKANVRLAIVLAIVAVVFFFGILVLKHP
jgi:DNA primase